MKFKILAAAALTAAAVGLSGAPAMAAGRGPSECRYVAPGVIVSDIVHTDGNNAFNNPGNAKLHDEVGPFVPFVIGCNPNVGAPIR